MPVEFPGIAATSRLRIRFPRHRTSVPPTWPAGRTCRRSRTRTAAVTGGSGNSDALVGTPETVAAAIRDYIDLGVDIISVRGYDLLADTIDVGQQVIPIVRAEVAKRDAAAPVPA